MAARRQRAYGFQDVAESESVRRGGVKGRTPPIKKNEEHNTKLSSKASLELVLLALQAHVAPSKAASVYSDDQGGKLGALLVTAPLVASVRGGLKVMLRPRGSHIWCSKRGAMASSWLLPVLFLAATSPDLACRFSFSPV